MNPRLLQDLLLQWYDQNCRSMPWRAEKGRKPDPYAVWLSEIMLQQTTVTAVRPYFQKFINLWPTISHLASASVDDVLAAWSGLGYYARARNLHKCARVIAAQGGSFPMAVNDLMQLPGVGPYTAAAIASIAFSVPVVAVDGNVERVVSRVFALETRDKKLMAEKACFIGIENERPSDFTQAFMELGAIVCTPRKPDCMRCPWREVCQAFQLGAVQKFPVPKKRAEKPLKKGVVFWLQQENGAFFIEKRKTKGLYEGMYQLPTTDWVTAGKYSFPGFVERLSCKSYRKIVKHSFTHFDLELRIWGAQISRHQIKDIPGGLWILPKDMEAYALPSLIRKVVQSCLKRQDLKTSRKGLLG